jgi:hypothetical protein
MSTKEKPKGTQGQQRKTPAECREAFNAFTDALEAENLSLEVNPENSRCSVAVTNGDGSHTTVLGPVAGNTFVKMLKGAQALAPHIRAA